MYHKNEDERKKWISNSKECFFSIKPSIDVFSSDKFLPPMVDLRLKFIRSDPSFGIIKNSGNTKEYIVKINKLHLQMRKIMPTEFAKDQFYRRIAMKEAQMAFKSSRIRNFQIPMGSTNSVFSNICNGNLPRSIIIGFVDSAAFSGVSSADGRLLHILNNIWRKFRPG